MTPEIARERVQRGAALLDEKRPGWAAQINTDTLNILDSCLCVMGQLKQAFAAGTWFDICGLAGNDECVAHGISWDGVVVPHEHATWCAEYHRQYDLLRAAWIDAITERLTPPVAWVHRDPVVATGAQRGERAGTVVP